MAGIIPYETGDIVEMKKKHPCGSSEWEILKAGADIKMKCFCLLYTSPSPRDA